MKIKIKTFNGELPEYLTLGCGYEIEHMDSHGRYYIYLSDNDEYVRIDCIDACPHLNGGSWEVVNE